MVCLRFVIKFLMYFLLVREGFFLLWKDIKIISSIESLLDTYIVSHLVKVRCNSSNNGNMRWRTLPLLGREYECSGKLLHIAQPCCINHFKKHYL